MERDSSGQKDSMMQQAANRPEISHVISTGDNFYSGSNGGNSGVESISDAKWLSHWFNVYKRGRGPAIESLPWMGVLGNHDWCGSAQAQIDYTQRGWTMDAFFWTRRQVTSGATIAFVFIDTNLIAYGVETKQWLIRDCPAMRQQFLRLGQSEDQHLRKVSDLLDSVQDADWIIVIGHHPLGIGKCGGEGRLTDLASILESKRVSAYFHGHVHASGYALSKGGVAHVLSGAGADPAGRSCEGTGVGSVWSQGAAPSFIYAEINGSELAVTFINQFGGVQYQAKSSRK